MSVLFLTLILKSPISIAHRHVDNRLTQIQINLEMWTVPCHILSSYLSRAVRESAFSLLDKSKSRAVRPKRKYSEASNFIFSFKEEIFC